MPDYTTFTFLDSDKDFPWFPEQTAQGLRMSRFGLMQEADPILALGHDSVPKIGEKYSEAQPYLTVVSKRVVATLGGRRGEGSGPTYKLEIQYATPTWSAAGSLKPALPGDTWTEVTFGTSTVTVYDEVGLELPEGIEVPPLNDGNGMARNVGTMEATIKSWFTREGFNQYNHARLVQMVQGYVNDAPVVLPNLMGSGFAFLLGEGQVLYVSAEYLREGEFWGIAHHVRLAPDWKGREVIKDENGMRVGFVLKQLYEPTDFRGLWN